MVLREMDDFLEVLHTETAPPGIPAEGALRFSVRVCSSGFSGSSASVWVDAAAFQKFLIQLRELESCRRGTARLEALGSPDEFWLELRAVDRLGHLAVFGELSSSRFLSTGQRQQQGVEFGFEFCPSLLPTVLREFASFAPGAPARSAQP